MSPTRVEAHLASETWLAEARRLAHVGSWEWDLDRDVFMFAEEMCRILGLPPEDRVYPRDVFQGWVHPADAARAGETLRRAAEEGAPFTLEHRIHRPDGRVRMLHSRGQLIEGATAEGRPRRIVGTSWDITEIWETASWPERSVSLLRATVEASADGILVVDLTRTIVIYNQRFLEIWRIPPELAERSDNPTLIQYAKQQLVDPDSFVTSTIDNHNNPEKDYFLTLKFKDGRIVERFSRPQRIGDEIVGRVMTFRDVTERERLLEEAQAAVRLRDEFLAIAAHEIRSPVASMRLAVQSLRAGTLAPERIPQALDIIDRSQRRLAGFVEKLLDLGRIRTGGLHLELERFDLAELVREVAARHEPDLARSGSTLSLILPAPAIGQWDRLRMDQVVTNLLSNAIKFGDGKPIAVSVDTDERQVRLVVSDQGIGIARESQGRIFQAFERGVSIRHFSGLGLGLYIVHTIVEGLGGTVEVQSDVGAGATFSVTLPVAPAGAT